jgi:putative hydrolases of HD superfamily
MAAAVGADADRAATIALLHDVPEARLGDLNHLARRYLDEAKPFERIVDDQTKGLPAEVRDFIRDRSRQWLKRTSVEADLARDADVIESILHVKESLADRPSLMDRWIDYLAASIDTEIGRATLENIIKTDPDDWWPRAVTEE